MTTTRQTFITEDFLLHNTTARRLYHDYAAGMPIIDYHNHLPPEQVATNHEFTNLTDVWLRGDHYKWRAMRANGIPENEITGDADDRLKHRRWAETLPYTLRNPLYHWSHLELQRYFGIEDLLSGENTDEVYDRCTTMLSQDSHKVLGLLDQFNVKVICTTDDPTDSLEHHRAFAEQGHTLKMFPSFRPDKAVDIGHPEYRTYVDKLSEVAGTDIRAIDDLLAVLEARIDFFHKLGARVSDHGLERVHAASFTRPELEAGFKKARNGQVATPEEVKQFQAFLLVELGKMYHARGWTQQFHLGAIRNNNARIIRQLGADAGADSIGDFSQARGLSQLLNTLNDTDQLAKTIVYNLNPADNELMATMVGNFNDGTIVGKMQFGSGWWFLDQLDGMEAQLNVLSNMGLVSRFVGMLTDSRSFLSFPRHEYFRRLLCNLFGQDVEKGLLPADEAWIGKIIQDICYHNANNYFKFPE